MVRLLVFLTVCLYALGVEAQLTRSKWWLARDIQIRLHLTAEQVKKINDIFDSTLPERRAQRQELDNLDREMDAMLASATADDQQAAALIQRTETARARRNIARSMLVYRMRRVLTPQQRRWFDTLVTKSDAGKSSPPIR